MKLTLLATLMCFISTVMIAQDDIPKNVQSLLDKHLCTTCHQLDSKLIGPSFYELAETGNSIKEISELIAKPNPANWPGYPPMAPMAHISKNELKEMAKWIHSLNE